MTYGGEQNLLMINELKITQDTISKQKSDSYVRGFQDGCKRHYAPDYETLNTMASYVKGYQEGVAKHVKH